MSDVEKILSALESGAGEVTQETDDNVQAAFNQLVFHIKRVTDMVALESPSARRAFGLFIRYQGRPERWRQLLGQALADGNADQDERILEAIEQLKYMLASRPAGKTRTRLPRPKRRNMRYEAAGAGADSDEKSNEEDDEAQNEIGAA